MEQKALLSACKDELGLVLSFFPRVDAKASVVLAVDTGMVGYLAAHLPELNSMRWWEFLAPACTIALLTWSFWYLYKGAFPQLKGGEDSLVYFREIARRTETKFIDDFMSQQEPAYIKDLLGQTWRNSQILKAKFDDLRCSFIFMAIAVVPWTISLADFALRKH
jgi:Family of unknown function (DUF5706)